MTATGAQSNHQKANRKVTMKYTQDAFDGSSFHRQSTTQNYNNYYENATIQK